MVKLSKKLAAQMARDLAASMDGSLEPIYALTNFSGQNMLASAVTGGERGVSTGFGAVLMIIVTSQGVTSAQRMAFANRTIGADGWGVEINGANANIKFTVANGTAAISSPVYTFSTTDVGRIHVFCGVYDAVAGLVRLYANGIEVGTGTAFTGTYAQSSASTAQAMGGVYGRTDFSSPGVAIVDAMTFRGIPTAAQVLDHAQRTRALNALADTLGTTTISHRWSPATQLKSAARLAPRYGLRTFALAARLETAVDGGIRGTATGFHVRVVATFRDLGTYEYLAAYSNASGTQGWAILRNGGTIRVDIGTGTYVSVSRALTTADLGVRFLIELVYDGTNLILRVDGVQAGSIAGSFSEPVTVGMGVGALTSGAGPAYGASIWEVSGAHTVPTLADSQAAVSSYLQTGKLPLASGTGAHHYDLSADIEAAGGVVPATVQDRVGSSNLNRLGTTMQVATYAPGVPALPSQLDDLITKAPADTMKPSGAPTVVAIDTTRDGRRLLGALGFSAANYLIAAPGKGLLGHAAGFVVQIHLRYDSVPNTMQMIVVNLTDDGGTAGWYLQQQSNGTIRFICTRASTNTISSLYTVTAADLGQPLLVTLVYTGSAVRLYVRRSQVGADVANGVTPAVTVGVNVFAVGRWGGVGTPAFTSGSIFAVSGADGVVPTTAQVEASYDATEAAGRLVPVVGTQHLWDLTQDCLPTESVPAVVKDRIGTDHLTRLGLDPAPVTKGLRNLSGAGYFASKTGLTGVATPWWIAVPIVPENQNTSASDIIVNRQNNPANQGWSFVADPNNAAYRIGVNSGGGFVYPPIAPILPGDVGTPQLLVVRHNGTSVELFYKGVRTSASPTAVSAYNIATNAMFAFGYRTTDAAGSVDANTLLGFSGGHDAITDAEIAQMYADFAATGRVPRVPGKTLRRYDIVQDVLDAGGDTPTKLVDREGSGDDVLRYGAPVTLAQRTERVWAYETTPILYGVNGLTAANSYSSPFGFLGSVTQPWWISMLVRFEAITGISSAVRFLCGRRNAAATAGYNLYTSGTNTLLALVASGSTGVTSPSYTMTAADVGKLMLIDASLDAAGKAHLFVKRAEVSTGSTTGSFATADAEPFYLGRRADGLPADNVTIFGFAAGYGAPSLSQVQAHHDLVMTTERMELIPGLVPANLYRIAPEGGAAPATIQDLVGTAHLTRAGSPTLHAQHARAWAA